MCGILWIHEAYNTKNKKFALFPYVQSFKMDELSGPYNNDDDDDDYDNNNNNNFS